MITTLRLSAVAAAMVSVLAFILGSVEIGLIFAMISGAIAMGFDGR